MVYRFQSFRLRITYKDISDGSAQRKAKELLLYEILNTLLFFWEGMWFLLTFLL
jgi:hypothetical protein